VEQLVEALQARGGRAAADAVQRQLAAANAAEAPPPARGGREAR
jgi:hypothetical protein